MAAGDLGRLHRPGINYYFFYIFLFVSTHSPSLLFIFQSREDWPQWSEALHGRIMDVAVRGYVHNTRSICVYMIACCVKNAFASCGVSAHILVPSANRAGMMKPRVSMRRNRVAATEAAVVFLEKGTENKRAKIQRMLLFSLK